jgi:hypothetical protein
MIKNGVTKYTMMGIVTIHYGPCEEDGSSMWR